MILNPYAMGSLWVTGSDWRIIAPTENGPQAPGAGGEIAMWISRDEGKSWEKDKQVTTGSAFNHNYVRRPLHAKDPFFAFWADGNPDRPSESRLYFCDSTGTRVHPLPYEMSTDSVLIE